MASRTPRATAQALAFGSADDLKELAESAEHMRTALFENIRAIHTTYHLVTGSLEECSMPTCVRARAALAEYEGTATE